MSIARAYLTDQRKGIMQTPTVYDRFQSAIKNDGIGFRAIVEDSWNDGRRVWKHKRYFGSRTVAQYHADEMRDMLNTNIAIGSGMMCARCRAVCLYCIGERAYGKCPHEIHTTCGCPSFMSEQYVP